MTRMFCVHLPPNTLFIGEREINNLHTCPFRICFIFDITCFGCIHGPGKTDQFNGYYQLSFVKLLRLSIVIPCGGNLVQYKV